jgi:hypothetical protein
VVFRVARGHRGTVRPARDGFVIAVFALVRLELTVADRLLPPGDRVGYPDRH